MRRKRCVVGNKKFRYEAADVDEEEPAAAASGDSGSGQWRKKNPELVGSKIPSFTKPVLSDEEQELLGSLRTAYDFYKLFQSDSFANEIVYQSRLYAVQKDFKKAQEIVNKNTYR